MSNHPGSTSIGRIPDGIAASQIFAVPSSLAVTICEPSG